MAPFIATDFKDSPDGNSLTATKESVSSFTVTFKATQELFDAKQSDYLFSINTFIERLEEIKKTVVCSAFDVAKDWNTQNDGNPEQNLTEERLGALIIPEATDIFPEEKSYFDGTSYTHPPYYRLFCKVDGEIFSEHDIVALFNRNMELVKIKL